MKKVKEIIFQTRGDAEEALSRLNDVIIDYGQASMADYYELCGLTNELSDHKYGWSNINNAYVKRSNNGYEARLPIAMDLDILDNKTEKSPITFPADKSAKMSGADFDGDKILTGDIYLDNAKSQKPLCGTNNDVPIELVIPNADTYTDPYTFCSKEVILKSYTEKIGKQVIFCGAWKTLTEVRITEKEITVIFK